MICPAITFAVKGTFISFIISMKGSMTTPLTIHLTTYIQNLFVSISRNIHYSKNPAEIRKRWPAALLFQEILLVDKAEGHLNVFEDTICVERFV